MGHSKHSKKEIKAASPEEMMVALNDSYVGGEKGVQGIVASYLYADQDFINIVKGSGPGFFPFPNIIMDAYKLLSAVVHGQPEQVVAMVKQTPRLLLEEGSITHPCGDVLYNISPLQAILFYQDWDMKKQVKRLLLNLPEEYDTKVRTQCRAMKGGGADLVKMTEDPSRVDFPKVLQFIDGDNTYPLLENKNGIIFYKNQFYYADQDTETVELIPLTAVQEAQIGSLRASFNDMEANSSRRSSDDEHRLIMTIMKRGREAKEIKLERGGIHYQRDGVNFQDTQVGTNHLITAHRKYIRVYNEAVANNSWDAADNAWLAIGREQKRSIPWLQRFCDNVPFSPLPDKESLAQSPFNRSLQFENWLKGGVLQSLRDAAVFAGLGVSFGLHKVEARCGASRGPGAGAGAERSSQNLTIVRLLFLGLNSALIK